MATEPERIARLELRMDRVESARQRVLDMLPLMAVLALLAGQTGWLWAQFQSFDDRLDRVENRLDGIDHRLDRIEALLAERLPSGR